MPYRYQELTLVDILWLSGKIEGGFWLMLFLYLHGPNYANMHLVYGGVASINNLRVYRCMYDPLNILMHVGPKLITVRVHNITSIKNFNLDYSISIKKSLK